MAYVFTGAKIKNYLKENYKFIQLPTPLSKKKKSVNNTPLLEIYNLILIRKG